MARVFKNMISSNTKNGEITINLNLTIKVDSDKEKKEIEDKIEYIMPEINCDELLEFGEEVK